MKKSKFSGSRIMDAQARGVGAVGAGPMPGTWWRRGFAMLQR